MRSIDAFHQDGLRRDLPPFRPGDTVRVHVKIREGEKERIQIFEGVCIQRRGGGPGATFTVRKISSGVGVERVFPVQSPSVAKLEIRSRGHVRRSRLFYLRDLAGKKARLRSKVRDLSALVAPDETEAGPPPTRPPHPRRRRPPRRLRPRAKSLPRRSVRGARAVGRRA
jgi:large subunit ribosomal protein L19